VVSRFAKTNGVWTAAADRCFQKKSR